MHIKYLLMAHAAYYSQQYQHKDEQLSQINMQSLFLISHSTYFNYNYLNQIFNNFKMAQEEGTFFATQIAQQAVELEQQVSPVQSPQTTPKKQIEKVQQDEYSLRKLLTAFNSHDKEEKGLIKLQNVQEILTLKGLPINNLRQYHEMSLPLFEELVSFDQFLFIFTLSQNDSQPIQDKYAICKKVDQRLIEFLRLLNNYRKKSEKNGNYKEAKNSKKKIQEIRNRQSQRRNKYLKILYENQVIETQASQKERFQQFCKKWDLFMNQYQLTASDLTKKVKQRQLTDIKQYEQRVRQQLAPKMHYSKYLLQLQLRQKNLVKLQQYEKAAVVQQQIQEIKIKELRQKQMADEQVIQLRLKTFRKQQESAISTLLQKIQKDRNDHMKQRQSQTQKLIVRNKSQLTQIDHRYNDNLKRIYQALNNLGLQSDKFLKANKK